MNTHVEVARTQMVNQQVRAWDVLDPAVLAVLAGVPRERFVPPRFRALAFADTAIPLPCGQAMLTPQVEGRLLQALNLTTADRVLAVGTGSGFMTACLARLAGAVTSIEIFPELADRARTLLQESHVRNAEVAVQDVFQRQSDARFDAIAVTGSIPTYDRRFQNWLTIGGRLFIVVGEPPVMEACLVQRLGEAEWASATLFETVIPPLLNAVQPEKFVF